MNHKAIYTLYPAAVVIDEDHGVFDEQGKELEIDMAAVESWVDPDEYRVKRAPEYLPFGELADALSKMQSDDPAVVAEGETQLKAYGEGNLQVKAKYPKTGVSE